MRHDLMISIFHEATDSGGPDRSFSDCWIEVALYCDCHKMIIALVLASLCLFANFELCWFDGMVMAVSNFESRIMHGICLNGNFSFAPHETHLAAPILTVCVWTWTLLLFRSTRGDQTGNAIYCFLQLVPGKENANTKFGHWSTKFTIAFGNFT